MLHIAWLLLALLSGFLCMQLAKIKGRSPNLWSVLGALFGPFALLILTLLKSKNGDSK